MHAHDKHILSAHSIHICIAQQFTDRARMRIANRQMAITPYKMALRAGKFDVPERFINFNA
jgi:hypothetical protein